MKKVKNTVEGVRFIITCPCCGMVSPTNRQDKERLRQSLLRKEEEQGS
jgi:hypothetical protein